MDRLIVTLDGPAGSGKSTVARLLARRLGLEFLDTGAMYRGIAAAALARGIDPRSEDHAVIELARNRPMHFDWTTDPPALHVGENDVTGRLRDADVTAVVSDIAAMGPVREVLVRRQQEIGLAHPRLVTEGRDQGSVVFPDAEAKFYLDASATVRARRRVDQLHAAGRKADLEQVRESILSRDRKDAGRAQGPLICPVDAQRIETSDMTLDQVVALLEERVRDRVREGV